MCASVWCAVQVIPSGRAPLTWYRNDYAADSSPTAVDALDMAM